MEWKSTVSFADLVRAVHGLNTADLGIVLPYLGAIAWLLFRACKRTRNPRPRRAYQAADAVDGLLRLLGGVAMAAIVILLALARAAGRSHYRW